MPCICICTYKFAELNISRSKIKYLSRHRMRGQRCRRPHYLLPGIPLFPAMLLYLYFSFLFLCLTNLTYNPAIEAAMDGTASNKRLSGTQIATILESDHSDCHNPGSKNKLLILDLGFWHFETLRFLRSVELDEPCYVFCICVLTNKNPNANQLSWTPN